MEMKKSLFERMLAMRERLIARIKQLEQYIDEYKEAGDYENAMKCDIKCRQLKLVESELTKELV